MKNSSLATGHLVDNYGLLKAQAADISGELDDIKTILIERHGESKHEGEAFRLSLNHSLTQRTDWKAVAAALAKRAGITDKALDALIADNSNLTDAWIARSAARVTK